MSTQDPAHGIEELAQLGGVSRRTVRYYIQEGLLPAPLGVGRGRHYDKRHLEALLRVKSLQESGHTLEEIRRTLSGRRPQVAAPIAFLPKRSLWRRFALAPGVELHVAGDVPLPSAAALEDLADWCRAHLGRGGDHDDDDEE
jgi:DNA-binding transcriptional MerR regulator